MNPRPPSIVDIPGIRVGHWTDLEAATGCTVVLCEAGAVAGVDVRGAAPGTRETDLLRPDNLVERVHAVVLSGGSAFGLAAADGVMRYLAERGIGYDTGVARVPIIPAAILIARGLGRADAWPDAEAGYAACLAAAGGPVAEGNVGAGTGATVGKLLGLKWATKAGLGTSSLRIGQGVIVGALVAVNALGDVVNPATGAILAGTRRPDGPGFADSVRLLQGNLTHRPPGLTNTTIGVVATNARLTKAQISVVARMAQAGIARTIRPAHTLLDGDALFALSFGDVPGDVTAVGSAAAEAVAMAVVRAVQAAETLLGVPASRDLMRET